MNRFSVLFLSLLLTTVAGCATVPSGTENLALPATNRIVVLSCYFKQPTMFSRSEPASKEKFSEFIQGEVSVFATELGKKMSEAGFNDVSLESLTAGRCEIKDDAIGGVTAAIMFAMVHQKFGMSEDMVIADTFIKAPDKDLMVSVGRRVINGGISHVSAELAAREMAPILIQKVRDAQKR